MEMMQADRTLLYSSDYPHWDNDDPGFVLDGMPDDLRRRITYENAVETFGDRLGL
jgi:predicted TIM-barrel fold metal-dependent hydrolase